MTVFKIEFGGNIYIEKEAIKVLPYIEKYDKITVKKIQMSIEKYKKYNILQELNKQSELRQPKNAI